MRFKKLFVGIVFYFILSACVEYPTCFKHPCMQIPGDTHATPRQQTYAASSMFSSAEYYMPKCKEFNVVNTKYDKSINENWWQEIWIIEACKTKWKGIVKFSFDGTVARSVGLEKIK